MGHQIGKTELLTKHRKGILRTTHGAVWERVRNELHFFPVRHVNELPAS